MNKMPAWSFSALSKYETCPRQYYLTKVAKVVREGSSVEIDWGNQVHKALELRVGEHIPLPETMRKWEPLAAKFDGKRPVVEHRIVLTRNLDLTNWKAPDAWVRGIIDVGVDAGKIGVLADWKTGKIKHNSDQLKLSAVMWMAIKPLVERVRTAFVWLAQGKITKEEICREDTPTIWRDFVSRTRRMEESYERDRWVPRPSGLCKGWCPVGREHCEYWSPKT